MKRFSIHIILLFILTVGVIFETVRYFVTAANSCMTLAQINSDPRCLYVYSGQIYEKGTKSNPYHGHACGSDVTNVIPSSHVSEAARYLDPSYITTVCTNTPTPTPTPITTPTPISPPKILMPSCQQILSDQSGGGRAPFFVEILATGKAGDNAKIISAVVNFGDGVKKAYFSRGIIRTNHIYEDSGDYNLSVIFVDSNSRSSGTMECTLPIKVIPDQKKAVPPNYPVFISKFLAYGAFGTFVISLLLGLVKLLFIKFKK